MARIGGRNPWIACPRACCAPRSSSRSRGSRSRWSRSRSPGWATCCAPPPAAEVAPPGGAVAPARASRRATSTAGRSIPTASGPSSPGRRTCCSSQTAAPPATAVTALTDALTPSVRITCHWRTEGGSTIVSTLAGVGRRRRRRSPMRRCADRASRARRMPMRSCVHAHRRATSVEEHVVRGGPVALERRDARGTPRSTASAPRRARVGLTPPRPRVIAPSASRVSRRCSPRSPTCSRSARGS